MKIAMILKYFITDYKRRELQIYYGSLNENKLVEFCNSLPRIVKQDTFPILELYRNDGKITCNLERYLNSEVIKNKHYYILEYKVKEEDIENKEFLDSKKDCSTIAYDVYIKWEELSEVISYINDINIEAGLDFSMDFSFVYKLLGQISSSEQQNKELFEAFKMCFDFEKTDQISFDELQTIFLSGNYKSLKLEHWILYFNEAFKIGIRNYEVFHHEKLKDSSLKYELIDFGNKTEVSNLSIENSMDRYIAFFKDEISGNSSQSFLLTILSDEGDLYTYQVAPYMPLLYQFVKELDRSYKITKEKTFTEIDWDCYENKPILTNWLDKSIIENDNYQILSFDVKKENIHIRMQKAESVHVKWEESIDLVIFIQDLISSLVYNEEADWSTVSKKFEEIPIDKQKKQQMYLSFLNCFQFDQFIEIIPNTVISSIETFSPHPTFDYQEQKMILSQKKELGKRNKKFLSSLIENGIIKFSKEISTNEDDNKNTKIIKLNNP